jgi:hypothetical protein
VTVDLRALERIMNDPEFVAAMERHAQEFPRYRDRLPVIPYSYTRTRLEKTSRYEVVAMQWAPGATSPIHDHGNSRCWVLMLEGNLDVENYERDDAAQSVELRSTGQRVLQPGDLDHRYGTLELHRVHNSQPQSAYSLQLYAEPIETYAIVDSHLRQSRLVTAVCDLDLAQ